MAGGGRRVAAGVRWRRACAGDIIPLTSGVALAAGAGHTCALLASIQVGYREDNEQGQVGDGSRPIDRLFATAVPSFTFNLEAAVVPAGRGPRDDSDRAPLVRARR